jgi:hypothetical protein
MRQIAEWLEKLGMPEYFAENDIDTAVLRHLTDQDLKELGVSLGHRRKMLAAIAEGCRCRADIFAARINRAEAARQCRTSASHGDVLGPSRFNGPILLIQKSL